VRIRGSSGQALPLLLVVLLVAVATMVVLGRLGGRAVDAARARTAADAAALAGAAEGASGAEALARANGSGSAHVLGGVGDATVSVRVGAVDARARAQAPAPRSGSGTSGLTTEMTAAVSRASALLGRPVPISSGWRSPAQQAALWAGRHSNPYPVAPPGTSMHERGLAIDVPRSFVTTLRAVAALAGLCQPLPVSDPVHFELCRRIPT
jgi:hypothetical protein